MARFDGNDWHAFGTDDGLPHADVYAVTTGPDGRVWAGTEQGIAYFDGQRWNAAAADDDPLGFADDTPVATQPVSALTVADGTVWAVTSETLARFDGEAWTVVTEPVPGQAGSIAVSDDAVWLGDVPHLLRFTR